MERGELRGVVALDGPSGTGKSTVARRLATQLGARYLDTGAMYRAATVAVLRAGVDPTDADLVRATVAGAELRRDHRPAGAGHHPGRRRRQRRDPRPGRHHARCRRCRRCPRCGPSWSPSSGRSSRRRWPRPAASWSRAATSARSSRPDAGLKVYLTATRRPAPSAGPGRTRPPAGSRLWTRRWPTCAAATLRLDARGVPGQGRGRRRRARHHGPGPAGRARGAAVDGARTAACGGPDRERA